MFKQFLRGEVIVRPGRSQDKPDLDLTVNKAYIWTTAFTRPLRAAYGGHGAGGELVDFNAMMDSARIVVKDVLALKEGETVLIVTNPDEGSYGISEALFCACQEAKASPTIVVQPVKTQLDFAEDATIAALKSNPDVAISISKEKLGKDREALKSPYKVNGRSYDHIFNYLLEEKKMRSFWSPGITPKMFIETIPIDYPRLREACARLKKLLDDAVSVRMMSPSGTDITIGLSGRKTRNDDGDFSKAGAGGNLPCGEVFISPELGTSSGTIAFDGSISSHEGEIIIETPILCGVEGGFVTDIRGGPEAKKLEESLTKGAETARKFAEDGKLSPKEGETYAKNARNLGELGIGLNEKAYIMGNMLQDEKVYGTCHIAIGSNYDEDAKALIHLDGLIKGPTLELVTSGGAKTVIMRDGKLTL